MKKIYYLLLLLLGTGIGTSSFSQSDCVNGRYLDEIFPNFTKTADIQFGNNLDYQGTSTDLFLDVYTPDGDTETERPVIVLTFGGSFIGGSKDGGDVVPLAEAFVKRGYVVVAHDYRLGMNGLPLPGPDSTDAVEAVLRGVHDCKAAIRWIYKEAGSGNQYGFDTTRIFQMGVSAGGFIGLHMAYLDDLNEIPSYLDTTQAGLGGGLEGNSGNPGYSSEVKAIVNLCGALGDTSWMKPGDLPVLSMHGTADATVPYGTAPINLLGFFYIQVVHGSASVHEQANRIGLENCFHTYVGQDHTPHVFDNAHLDTTIVISANFLHNYTCTSLPPEPCEYTTSVGVEELLADGNVVAYPNPAKNTLNIALQNVPAEGYSVELVNMMGTRVWQADDMRAAQVSIPRNGLPAGMYVLTLRSGNEQFQQKILFE